MKLSMWMIANRISTLEPELHIRENARPVLKSARLVYATDCAVVTAQGTTVICYDNENSILLKRMSLTQGFELIQGVFDFYQDWLYDVKRALGSFHYQKVIDLCWTVFHNPILLFNGNHQILAMSEQYLDEEMDEEWGYIEKYGYPSLEGMKERRKGRFLSDIERAQYYPCGNNVKYGSLSSPICFRDKICGRIVVMERDRPLNAGDAQLINLLVEELRLPLAEQCDGPETDVNFDCIGNLLEGKNTNPQSLALQLSALEWRVHDTFKLSKLCLPHPQEFPFSKEQIIMETIRRQITGCSLCRGSSCLYLIQNLDRFPEQGSRDNLTRLIQYNHLCCVESLPIQGIHNLHFLRQQADYVMQRVETLRQGQRPQPHQETDSPPVFSFYHYAIDYIIASGDLEKSMYAVHPGLLKLWHNKENEQDDHLNTYICYLRNGKSLKKTAEQLYLHRNTLVYRLNKINETFSLGSGDAYTEDYINLSIRVLEMMDHYQKYSPGNC